MASQICIHQQQVSTKIGITAEERALPQVLEITTTIKPQVGFENLQDDIQETVDYFAVYQAIQHVALAKERDLLETLAREITEMIQERFAVEAVKVDIDKFILPNVQKVTVSYSVGRGNN